LPCHAISSGQQERGKTWVEEGERKGEERGRILAADRFFVPASVPRCSEQGGRKEGRRRKKKGGGRGRGGNEFVTYHFFCDPQRGGEGGGKKKEKKKKEKRGD